ncbi:MAG: nicotinate phosphoribosyltransferase [Promethearchaeota archaeon]
MNYEHSLLTDFYQLTMANAYLEKGMAEKRAVFDLFFRKAPFNGTYAICYGINNALNGLSEMKYSGDSLNYIKEKKIFSDDFLEYLAKWKCELSIRSIDDGRVVFPYEPILEVDGPLIQCQLVETFLLNTINFSTLCATKANRMWLASGKQPILEFGLRRAQGPNGGLKASEAAMVGGCVGTSNVLAGKIYGMDVSGTQAHSWVMAFDSELESFRAYADIYPDSCVLLIDTYDTIEGCKNAIIVGKELKKRGKSLLGVRIDSGDLTYFSKEVRKMLDQSGLNDTKIIASSDIDEYLIAEIKNHGGKVDIWGVGTKLATCFDDPALGGVYKLVSLDDQPKVKVASEVEKTTIPSKKNVFRVYDNNDIMTGDIIELAEKCTVENDVVYDPLNPMRNYVLSDTSRVESLLNGKLKKGKLVKTLGKWPAARKLMEEDISHLSDDSKRLLSPKRYKVSMSRELYHLRTQLIKHHSIH